MSSLSINELVATDKNSVIEGVGDDGKIGGAKLVVIFIPLLKTIVSCFLATKLISCQ